MYADVIEISSLGLRTSCISSHFWSHMKQRASPRLQAGQGGLFALDLVPHSYGSLSTPM